MGAVGTMAKWNGGPKPWTVFENVSVRVDGEVLEGVRVFMFTTSNMTAQETFNAIERGITNRRRR